MIFLIHAACKENKRGGCFGCIKPQAGSVPQRMQKFDAVHWFHHNVRQYDIETSNIEHARKLETVNWLPP